MAGKRITAIGTIIAAVVCAAPAAADTYTPTTFEDNGLADPFDSCSPSPGDPFTLREAVAAANQHEGDDEVVLTAGTYEINPSLDQIEVEFLSCSEDPSGKLLIRGAGARETTIDGNGSADDETRVFGFDDGVEAELRDAAVTGGYVNGSSNGGAIKVRGSGFGSGDAEVLFKRVWLHDNTAEGDGGAISNRGKLTLDQSLVSNNDADGAGGGIENDDQLWLVNSTISGNDADGDEGGGIDNDADDAEEGATPALQGSALTEITEETPGVFSEASTIADNEAGTVGGGIATEEVPFRGDAIHESGSPASLAKFHNTIVSDNRAPGERNCSGNAPADSEDASSNGYNLEDGETCEFTAEGDKDAASGLGALANNGGRTDTQALNEGSAAIDGGDTGEKSCEGVDQRDVTRPQRARCDIGAFEREPAPAPQQQEQIQQPITPQGDPCADKRPPVTVLRGRGLAVRDDRVVLSGTSRDLGAPCPSGVQRIEVSMAKVSGTALNCRFIRRANRFVITPFRNCRRPILFVARGTTRWTFTFQVALAPGKYRAQARGYDVARNKETPKKRRNIVYFTVK